MADETLPDAAPPEEKPDKTYEQLAELGEELYRAHVRAMAGAELNSSTTAAMYLRMAILTAYSQTGPDEAVVSKMVKQLDLDEAYNKVGAALQGTEMRYALAVQDELQKVRQGALETPYRASLATCSCWQHTSARLLMSIAAETDPRMLYEHREGLSDLEITQMLETPPPRDRAELQVWRLKGLGLWRMRAAQAQVDTLEAINTEEMEAWRGHKANPHPKKAPNANL